MNTPRDTAEPFSHAAGVYGNTYFKKGRKSPKMRRREQKEWEAAQGKNKVRQGEGDPPQENRNSLKIMEQVYSEELESMKTTHIGAWEKCEEEGAAGCCVFTAAPAVQFQVG